MKRFVVGFVYFLSLCMISGCLNTSILERQALTIASGYDFLEEQGKIQVTTVLLQSEPEAREKTHVVSSIADTIKGARQGINRKLHRSLVAGQLRVILFNQNLAKKGITDFTNTVARDPSIGDMIYLAVSEGPSMSLLNHRYTEIANIGNYLFRMLDQNIKTNEIPSSTIHEFRRDVQGVGRDAVLPILKEVDDEVVISGIALFHDDRMVDSVSPKNGAILNLILHKNKLGFYEVVMERAPLSPYILNKKGGKVKAVIKSIKNNSQIKLVSTNPVQFNITSKIEGELEEISHNYNFQPKGAVAELEKQLGLHIRNEIMQFTKVLQTKNSDAFGLGEVYRSSVRHSRLTKDKWHEMFPEARIDVQVNVNIMRTGMIE